MISATGVARAGVVAVAAVLLAAGGAMAEDWSPLWSTANLSRARYTLSAASAGGKVFFAGGRYSDTSYSNVVDIYDTGTGLWSTSTLSEPHGYLAAASTSAKVFFGGGLGSPITAHSKVVEIYDTDSGSWSVAHLSQARNHLSAASAGGKVFFAGGNAGYPDEDSNVVDIYDTATALWSTATLSQARFELAASSAGGKVFFAGGLTGTSPYFSNVVDIYDTATGLWSTATLSEARTGLSATSWGNKVFFGGGRYYGNPSSVVDIYDTATGLWSTATLSQARYNLSAASAGGKVFFAGGLGGSWSNVVDIYDTTTALWSTATLSEARRELSATSWGNKVFFGGGQTDDGNDSSVVDIYTLQNYGTITSSKVFTLVDHTTVAGRMQLDSPGSLSLAGYNLVVGSMSGEAPINLGTSTLTAGGDGTSSTYSGALSGHGGLTKTGAGMLTLSATSSYDGTTRVSGGALKVTGSIAASSALIDGGTLQGTGRVGDITGTSGHLHPGGSPGILASGSLALSPGFNFDVSLDGPAAGTDYSQLDVTGTVDLGGANLEANLGYAPAWYSGGGPPDFLYIIKNDGTDPVTGQFDGLPQMSQFDLLYNGTAYKATISYQGDYDAGTLTGGNDVVAALPEPATLSLLALGGLGGLLRPRKGRRLE